MGASLSTWAHGDHTAPDMLKAHLVYKSKGLHIHAQLTAPPVVGHEAFLNLEIRNAKDHSLINTNDQVDVELWMPDMGHGSAPTHVNRSIDSQGKALTGQYVVSNVYFVMGGLWEIRITLTDPNGQQETQSFTLQMPEGEEGHH
ncbi:MAG: FixH family protein [Bdellovibrionaceae bacterium]|nr:FixH family protein [Pseudobdellovibrionaceae bacterium]